MRLAPLILAMPWTRQSQLNRPYRANRARRARHFSEPRTDPKEAQTGTKEARARPKAAEFFRISLAKAIAGATSRRRIVDPPVPSLTDSLLDYAMKVANGAHS